MKILIVDDEKNIVNFLKLGLEEECFEVDVAYDGERGSFLARTNDYDLVLLDYALPKKDGLTVCKEIRRDEKHVPILVLSVMSTPKDKAELINSGADDYLTKPFSLDELIARIRALLRRSPQIKSEILAISDLVLDTRKHTVKRGDKNIYLTLKEFMLLEFLLRNKGSVVSRGMILEHVWDMNSDLFSNTIEAHMSSLRKKIDLPERDKLIHTISGRGYKIDVST